MRRQLSQPFENHLKLVPDDARGRIHLAGDYVSTGRVEEGAREVQFAVALRLNDANVMYNVACGYSQMNKKDEALAALKKAWDAGLRDGGWARRDPDLALLHGDPEFKRLYPETEAA